MWIEIKKDDQSTVNNIVAPHAGVWIEIGICQILRMLWNVAPHAGVWIEILISFPL